MAAQVALRRQQQNCEDSSKHKNRESTRVMGTEKAVHQKKPYQKHEKNSHQNSLARSVLQNYRQWMVQQQQEKLSVPAAGSISSSTSEVKNAVSHSVSTIASSTSAWDPFAVASHQASPASYITERMRKRRAFADRDLEAIMFEREQIALSHWQQIMSSSPTLLFNVKFDSFQPMAAWNCFGELAKNLADSNCAPYKVDVDQSCSLKPKLPLASTNFLKSESNPNSGSSETNENSVGTSQANESRLKSANKNRISFSVDSIIGVQQS